MGCEASRTSHSRGFAVGRGAAKPKRIVDHAATICDVLIKMTPEVRREVIQKRTTDKHRIALEKEMVTRKAAKSGRAAVQAICCCERERVSSARLLEGLQSRVPCASLDRSRFVGTLR